MDILRNLWNCLKGVKPLKFQRELRIAVQAMQGNQPSSCVEGESDSFLELQQEARGSS